MKNKLCYLLLLFIFNYNSIDAQSKHFKGCDTVKNKMDNCCCENISPCFENDTKLIYIQPDKSIVIDFKAKKVAYSKDFQKIKPHQYFQVKVVNYNPNLYKISIDGIDSSNAVPVETSLLSSFFSPDKLTGIVANLGAVVAAIQPNSTTNGQEAEQLNEKKMHNDKICKNVDKYQKNVIQEIANVKKEFDFFKLAVEEYFYSYANNLLQQNRLSFNRCSIKKIDTCVFRYDFNLYRTQLIDKKDSAINFYDRYKMDVSGCLDRISNDNKLRIADSLITSFFQNYLSDLKLFDSLLSYKNLLEIEEKINAFNEIQTCYQSLPISFNDDYKKLNISILPTEEKSKLQSYNFEIQIPQYARKTYGISNGIYVSGLKNKNYSLRKGDIFNKADTSYRFVREGASDIQMGVNALGYYGHRLCSNNNWYGGFTLGVGLSVEGKPKPRFLAGVCLLRGSGSRFMLSIGIIGGSVIELSKAYFYFDKFPSPPVNYQTDVFKTSGFLSLNYNIISK